MNAKEVIRYSTALAGLGGLSAMGISAIDSSYDILPGTSPLYSQENALAFKQVLKDLRVALPDPSQQNWTLQERIVAIGSSASFLGIIFTSSPFKSISVPASLTLSALAGVETYEILTSSVIPWYENISAGLFYSGASATMAAVGLETLVSKGRNPLDTVNEVMGKIRRK